MTEKSSPSAERSAPVHNPEAVSYEMASLVRALAHPASIGESRKVQWARVARRARLTASQVKRLWYQEWANVPAHIADQVRAAYRQKQETAPAVAADRKSHAQRLDAAAAALDVARDSCPDGRLARAALGLAASLLREEGAACLEEARSAESARPFSSYDLTEAAGEQQAHHAQELERLLLVRKPPR